jgi:D-3-phosphoglycerate dehydrogenase / 2-oxoglutarate reductase
MKILIADKFSEDAVEELRAAGHTVRVDAGLKGGALTEAIADFEPSALVVRSTKVTAADLDASGALELVVRAGAGVDTIDLDGASKRGIFVANCPGKNAVAVAELAFGLILALDRRIPDNVIDARAGRWAKGQYSKAAGLRGRTLGLIGMGSIGQEMVRRARGFEMPVVAWSRSLTERAAADMGVAFAPDPLAVASRADVVSLHVASTPDTRHLVDRAFVEAMKPGAFLINTARSTIVDEEAVRVGLDEKGLRYGTDVPAGEPADKEAEFLHPLANHPGVYITHHIGASTDEATAAIGAEALRVLLTYADSGAVVNGVNLADQTPASHLLTVRHRDRVGVLAGVLDEARRANWNVQEMENLIFAGAEAACARIRFDGRPSADTLRAIREQEHVLAATVIPL